MAMLDQLGENLTRLRVGRGFTQEDLGRPRNNDRSHRGCVLQV
ncbi:MAG TPA: hypothetical protein VGM60_11685 [Pseudonocardia sp.]